MPMPYDRNPTVLGQALELVPRLEGMPRCYLIARCGTLRNVDAGIGIPNRIIWEQGFERSNPFG